MSEFHTAAEPQPPVLSGIPPRKSRQGVVAWGENRGTVPSLEASFDGWAKGKPEADVEVMKALLADGIPLITTGDWNQFVTVFTQYSSDGTRGNKTAEEILGTIQTSVG